MMSNRISALLPFAFLLLAASNLFGQQSGSSIPPMVAAPSPAPEAAQTVAPAERWDALSIRDSKLEPIDPIPGEVDRYPEFTRELLRVEWRGGDPVDLYIVRPVGVAKPPVVLYLYGYPEEATRFLNDNLCKTVTRNGFAAVGFSSMLTGQRYHDVPMKEWFVSDLQQSLVGTAHDVQMVLGYLAKRGDFDMTRVGIFGEGSGGTIALLAASVDPRIKAVDVLDPWGDWAAWLATSPLVPAEERASYLKPAFLTPLAAIDPINLLPRWSSPSLRVQQTAFDAVVPDPVKLRIASAVPTTAELARYKDQQEYLDKVGSNGRMLDWMYAHLQPSAAANPGASDAGKVSSANKPSH